MFLLRFATTVSQPLLMALHGAVLQASTIAMISLGARIPQIWMNYKRGNSGELSLLTCLMNVCGCFARMFTTIVLTKVFPLWACMEALLGEPNRNSKAFSLPSCWPCGWCTHSHLIWIVHWRHIVKEVLMHAL